MESEETFTEVAEDPSSSNAATRTGAGFLVGLVFGVFLGAGLALAFVSDRGADTRNRLRRRMRSLREDALETLDEAGTRTRDELRRRQRKIKAELERIRERAKERAKEIKESRD
jgi:gas vesicle protein